jgi:hypothetical protein
MACAHKQGSPVQHMREACLMHSMEHPTWLAHISGGGMLQGCAHSGAPVVASTKAGGCSGVRHLWPCRLGDQEVVGIDREGVVVLHERDHHVLPHLQVHLARRPRQRLGEAGVGENPAEEHLPAHKQVWSVSARILPLETRLPMCYL